MRDRAVELAEKLSESARASAGLATTGPSRGWEARARPGERRGGAFGDCLRRAIRRRRPPRAWRGASGAAPAAENLQFDVNFRGRRSAGDRARARRATYLDLGRLEGGDRAGEGGGNAGHFDVLEGCVVWCVCGNGASITRGRCLQARRDAILPTRKIFCPFDFFRTAKQSRFPTENASRQTCQPGLQNRASPQQNRF